MPEAWSVAAARRSRNAGPTSGCLASVRTTSTREHVGGALPDRQHLGVAEQPGDAGVLDVAGAAEALQVLAGRGDGELAGGQLGQRGDQAQLAAGRRVAVHLGPAEQREGVRGQREGGLRVDGQRAPACCGATDWRSTVHPRHCARRRRPGRRPGRGASRPRRRRRCAAGSLDEGHHPGQPAAGRVADRQGVRVVQPHLGGRHGPGAELVLEPVQGQPGRGPSGGAVKPASGQSAAYRGTRNGARRPAARPAPSGRASATAIAESIAEQNHFSPAGARSRRPPAAPSWWPGRRRTRPATRSSTVHW